nr:HlyD family secretion protein [Robbsia betulipollinis]
MCIFAVAILAGRLLWQHYMDAPWTRDARVRADIVNVAPDVSGMIVDLPVHDNQFVHRGELLMQIDPERYRIAVAEAQALLAARGADLQMRRRDAARRADLDSLVVSSESRENAVRSADSAAAQYQAAQAQLDAARLNLSRTRVLAPVDGYVTNLLTHRGDYAAAGVARVALIDSASFWVYGYFEETKLPHIKVGDAARMQMMSGEQLQGHVESIARGITDRDNPVGHELISDVNPTFNWVRLAQRVPVRIHIDAVPPGMLLAAGTTCTVVVTPAAAGTGADTGADTDAAGPGRPAGPRHQPLR